MNKFTKERLEEIAGLARKATYKPCAMHMTNLLVVCDSEVIEEMARQLLAGLEQEPVAWKYRLVKLATEAAGPWKMCLAPMEPGRGHAYRTEVITLYAAPQPDTVVPDEQYQHLSELYHAQEKRLFKIAQRIKGPAFDKYAYSPSQAIDVLESAIFGEQEGDCAAIQSFGNSEQPEPVSNHDELPVTQFKPVADLYGITSPTGSETIFTFDAVEARDFIDGGWSCQEYVELERYQAAMTNQSEQVLDMVNSPATTDGWIPVSEQMPEADCKVLANVKSTAVEYQCLAEIDENCRWWDEYGEQLPSPFVTHWQPLPASPQQEAK